MSWVEVAFELKGSQVEQGTHLLENLHALAISLYDAKDTPIFEPPPNAEPILWEDSVLVGLFEEGCLLPHIKQSIQNQFPKTALMVRSLSDQNWVALSQAQFPMQTFGHLCICPSWEEAPQDPDKICLHLDPGMAFGTGTHATTSLCLTWISESDLDDKVVIDYGCGSGILALACALMGAKRVFGVDYDLQALQSSRSNQEKNKLDNHALTFHLPEELPNNEIADIIIANILAAPLKALKNDLCNKLNRGASLVLSGILVEQKEEIIEHYSDSLLFITAFEKDGWVLLHFKKESCS